VEAIQEKRSLKEATDASILYEMQSQARDDESSSPNLEEQQAGNTRIMRQLRDEDVPDRQGIRA